MVMLAKDIMTKKVITASPNEKIKKIVSKMEKNGINEVPITGKNNHLKGMVTYYDILDFTRLDPEEKVASIMMMPPTAEPETHVNHIIELMLKTGVEALPIVENGKIVGLISDYDILKKMINNSKIKKLKVRDIMEEQIKILKEDDPISLARRVMRYNKWPKLPIVGADGKLSGMITSMDILKAFYNMPKEGIGRQDRGGDSISPLTLPVKSLMRKNIPEVHPKEGVNVALKKLFDARLKGVPVVDKDNKVIGLFERWHVLDKILEKKFKEGVWLNFSGFPLSVETIELIKEYLSSDIRKMKMICKDLKNIDIHIKKLHGATPEKWNYEVYIHLQRKAGKGEVVTSKDPWYGYNLMFTLQDAFNRLFSQLERKCNKK